MDPLQIYVRGGGVTFRVRGREGINTLGCDVKIIIVFKKDTKLYLIAFDLPNIVSFGPLDD
jgi:hypothetical protein